MRSHNTARRFVHCVALTAVGVIPATAGAAVRCVTYPVVAPELTLVKIAARIANCTVKARVAIREAGVTSALGPTCRPKPPEVARPADPGEGVRFSRKVPYQGGKTEHGC